MSICTGDIDIDPDHSWCGDMRVVARDAGHGHTTVLLENGCLTQLLAEAPSSHGAPEAGSTARLPPLLHIDDCPDVIAEVSDALGDGHAGIIDSETIFDGHRVRRISSSRVRSHILCSYALAPFPQGQPCYALVWDSHVGSMYYIDEQVQIEKIGDVLTHPGSRYALLHALAGDSVHSDLRRHTAERASQLMGLAARGRRAAPTAEQMEIIEAILSVEDPAPDAPRVATLSRSRFRNMGFEAQSFMDLLGRFSNEMFERFHRFAKQHVTSGLPLLICGGCGLNCEWNTQWQQCGLFTEVFVPPCTDASGLALGAAADAFRHCTGHAKIDWTAYAGEPFVEDVDTDLAFRDVPLNLGTLCECLLAGGVIAWVQGRQEIGPRTLGNRSLLAAPFSVASRVRLNRIRQRAPAAPLAAICLDEDFGVHFEHYGLSPHGLYLQRVKSASLSAITHVDGTARAQSVGDEQNPTMCALLREFRAHSDAAVLCISSLKSGQRAFVNRLSDLFGLARDRGIDAIVVGGRLWISRRSELGRPHSRDVWFSDPSFTH
jgi:predicted NodU family carbamoyl transferase